MRSYFFLIENHSKSSQGLPPILKSFSLLFPFSKYELYWCSHIYICRTNMNFSTILSSNITKWFKSISWRLLIKWVESCNRNKICMPDTMRRTCTRFKIAFLILEVALESTFFLLEMSGFTQSLRYSEYGCVIMSFLDFPTLLIPDGDENPSQRRWAAVKVTQSCPTLWDPMDYTVHGILQARILEWVAFPFSRGSSQPRNRTRVSCIAGIFFTNWAIREAQRWVELFYNDSIRLLAFLGSPARSGACAHQAGLPTALREGDETRLRPGLFRHTLPMKGLKT